MSANDFLVAVTHYPLFSLTLKAQIKKLQKRNADWGVSPLASGDLRLCLKKPRAFEKARAKLFNWDSASIVRFIKKTRITAGFFLILQRIFRELS